MKGKTDIPLIRDKLLEAIKKIRELKSEERVNDSYRLIMPKEVFAMYKEEYGENFWEKDEFWDNYSIII